jgi:hypothetical protein
MAAFADVSHPEVWQEVVFVAEGRGSAQYEELLEKLGESVA